jgi:uncharacterized protein (DUF1684 family)
MTPYEELLDWRRAVAALYAAVRQSEMTHEQRRAEFRLARDRLFKTHPQSPLALEQRPDFRGLDYYSYDPAYRFVVGVDAAVEPGTFTMQLQDDGPVRLQRFGKIALTVEGQPVSLSLFWIMGYGGGIFLPFRDATNSRGTYGGGRYLLDTIKHADLGHEDGRLVVDFNYAYNPSCAYNPHWHCPLAPLENHLPVPIRAGEKEYAI